MKRPFKSKPPAQSVSGVRSRVSKGKNQSGQGRPHDYNYAWFKTEKRGHGPLDELERRLAKL